MWTRSIWWNVTKIKNFLFFLIENKINFYERDCWLFVVIIGCWRRFCRSSLVTLFVRFNESLFIFGDGVDWWVWLDLLFVDERPKKYENFVFDCRVDVVVIEERRSDNESIHTTNRYRQKD